MWCGASMNSFYYVNAQYQPAYRDNPCSSMVYRWKRQLVFCCECELAGFSQRMKLIFILHLRPLPSGMIARLGIREKKVSMKIARFLEIVVYFSPLPFLRKVFLSQNPNISTYFYTYYIHIK